MKISLSEGTMTLTLREMSEIITGRKNAALMETKMPDGRENPLSVEYNEGVKMMSKYMADYFLNEFDMAQYKADADGLNIRCELFQVR